MKPLLPYVATLYYHAGFVSFVRTFTSNHSLLKSFFHIGGGVRLRSRLSPGGGRNQKCHFKAKTDTFFINSFKNRAYYVNSYKKLDQKAQNLNITSFTMGLGPK